MKTICTFLSVAVSFVSVAGAESIWWGVGDATKHQGSVCDDTGAPKGKLLSDNLHWYGPAVFTGCTYEYDGELYVKDEIRPTLNRFLRDKKAPPPEPVFGRLLLNSRVGGKESCVVGVMGKPIKAVFDFKRPCSFTEVDFMCDMDRSKPYKGEVSFSDDKAVWSAPVPFEGTQSVCRVRFDKPMKGRYMRFSFGSAGGSRERQYLDEVVAWGDGEVSEKFPEAGFSLKEQNSVGARVGQELQSKALWAVVWSLALMLVYIAIRFDFSFGVGAVVALIHNILVTIGLYVVCGRTFTMTSIAAFLTVLGYSINDTIVVFDRLRETAKLRGGKLDAEGCNLSINSMLARTILTSVTTLISLAALMVFGRGEIFDFAVALSIGVCVGTYASVFIATPVMLAVRPKLEIAPAKGSKGKA